jgi:hypothetical protein
MKYRNPRQLNIKKKSFPPEDEAELRFCMKKCGHQEDEII